MALVADTSSKGLWIAPGTVAGTHALIVGVSSYPFLSGGSAPVRAPNSGGLPQLRNSALTAARIFDWLKGAESVAGATVASCRLLLSPVEAEKAEIDRLTGGNYGVPDFEIFRAAIEAWRNAIFAARNEHGTNTAFFFFSGHGVEHLASPALLAADILDPNAAGSETRAVAIEAVGRAIKTSGIDRALLFVDACRNAPAVAMTLHIVGQEIINPVPYPARSPDAVMSLQSTRSGLQSFQAPDDPATIFGRAVIEALDGPPPSYAPYDVASAPWALRFASFESYVKKRVPELLAAYTASKTQPVEASGMPYDREMVVASRSPLAPPPVSTLTPPDIATVIAQRSDDLLQHFKTFSTGLGGDRPTAPGIGDISDYSTMHEVFGHESVTVPFLDALSVLDARTGQPFPTSDLHLMLGRSSERADTLTTWLDVEIPRGRGESLWIGLSPPHGSASFAVAIPRDSNASMPVRLDIGFRKMEGNWTIDSFAARLAEPHGTDEFSRTIWRPLWELQRVEALSDLGSAGLLARQVGDLQMALYEKGMSQVGAAIAAATLIRSGNLDAVYDWPKNLADRFPWLPDGGVLWAETLLRRIEASHVAAGPGDPRYREARDYGMRGLETGLPLLGATLKMALNQTRIWNGMPEPASLSQQKAISRLLKAAECLVSGSLFASFWSAGEALRPGHVLGTAPG